MKDLPLRIIKPPLDLALEKQLEQHQDQEVKPNTAVTTAVDSAVTNAVQRPEDTAVDSTVNRPVTTAVDKSETPTAQKISLANFEYLDATHTSSEAKIYSVMYRECQRRKVNEYRFGLKELRQKTGLSDKTLRVAIHSLEQKLSIKTVEPSQGIYGRKFRVYHPKDILIARRQQGIKIDPVTKKIITAVATGVNTAETTEVSTPETTAEDTTAVTGSTPVKTTAVSAVNPTALSREDLLNRSNIDISKSSSGKEQPDDKSHLNTVRRYYESMTGNEWSQEDGENYQKVHNIKLDIIESAMKYTKENASSRINSFKYFIKQILSDANPSEQARSQIRKKLTALIEQIRELHTGLSVPLTIPDLEYKVIQACEREGIHFDKRMFNEIIEQQR